MKRAGISKVERIITHRPDEVFWDIKSVLGVSIDLDYAGTEKLQAYKRKSIDTLKGVECQKKLRSIAAQQES